MSLNLFPYVAGDQQRNPTFIVVSSSVKLCTTNVGVGGGVPSRIFFRHDFWDPGNFNFMICSYPLPSSTPTPFWEWMSPFCGQSTLFESILKIVLNSFKQSWIHRQSIIAFILISRGLDTLGDFWTLWPSSLSNILIKGAILQFFSHSKRKMLDLIWISKFYFISQKAAIIISNAFTAVIPSRNLPILVPTCFFDMLAFLTRKFNSCGLSRSQNLG